MRAISIVLMGILFVIMLFVFGHAGHVLNDSNPLLIGPVTTASHYVE